MSSVAPYLAGARVLDLFAGSGALGLEALSRGAGHTVFVEQAEPALRVLRANIQALDAGACTEVIRTDALRYVAGLEAGAFGVAFADPPYGTGAAAALAEAFTACPFAEIFGIEHGPRDLLPELPSSRTRRYGDVRITLLSASP
jgi:16S rRNA (guanine966-N2)-methyltransferase